MVPSFRQRQLQPSASHPSRAIPRWGTSFASPLPLPSIVQNSESARRPNVAPLGDNDGGLGAMSSHSRTTSFSANNPRPVRRPSVNSRLSFAVSSAERGENPPDNGQGIAAQHQIEEELAKIKRYEVGMALRRAKQHARNC